MSDGLTPLTPDQIALQELRASHEGYVHRTLVALDQFANVIADGAPDMTISSRAAIAAKQGKTWGIGLSKLLDVFQANHGMKADAGDLERAQTVVTAEDETLGNA